MDQNQLHITKGENMSMKDYATQMVEKQLDVVKELLVNNEITEAQAADKIEQIENTNLYLCLNTASLMKDRIIKERNEIKKLENQNKTR
jgi:DNA repair exonuclease SbcCD nuclease subunit